MRRRKAKVVLAILGVTVAVIAVKIITLWETPMPQSWHRVSGRTSNGSSRLRQKKVHCKCCLDQGLRSLGSFCLVYTRVPVYGRACGMTTSAASSNCRTVCRGVGI